jgi:hypothetical protein
MPPSVVSAQQTHPRARPMIWVDKLMRFSDAAGASMLTEIISLRVLDGEVESL